jgi:hypothetical protein
MDVLEFCYAIELFCRICGAPVRGSRDGVLQQERLTQSRGNQQWEIWGPILGLLQLRSPSTRLPERPYGGFFFFFLAESTIERCLINIRDISAHLYFGTDQTHQFSARQVSFS